MVLLENQELVLIGGASDGSVQGLGVPWGSWANPSPRNLSERANGLCNSSHKLHYFVGAEQTKTDLTSASQASYLIFLMFFLHKPH